MLAQFRKKVGLWYSMLHFGRRKDHVLHFTRAISTARNALVCIPESVTDPLLLDEVFEFLTRKFSSNNVILVSKKQFSKTLPTRYGFALITYSDEDLNQWFLPRSELLRKVKKSTFDLALDLNRDFALTSAYLCRESQAPLRVSFTKRHADEFYNFQIQTREQSEEALAYTNLLNCMQMF